MKQFINNIFRFLCLVILICPHISSAQEITDFYPTETTTSGLITVVGTDLGSANGVQFNGIQAEYFYKVSETKVVFAVPAEATTGTFTVTGVGLTSNSPVTIDSFSTATLGTIDFTDASGTDDEATLDPSSPYNFYLQSGTGLEFSNAGYGGGSGDNLGVYLGASGRNYGVVRANDPSAVVIMDGVNTEGYEDLALAFGVSPWRNTDLASALQIEYRDKANNGSWVNLEVPNVVQRANKWHYLVLTDGAMPQTSDLEFRFTILDANFQYRVDDISLIGKVQPPTVNFVTTNLSINENDQPIEIELSLSKTMETDMVISLETTGTIESTAYSLLDAAGENLTNTITIPAGETSGKAILDVFDNDVEEDTKTLNIGIESIPAPGVIGDQNEIVITIFDDDSPATLYNLTIDKDEITEGNEESIPVTAHFTKAVTGLQVITFGLPEERTHERAYSFGENFTITVDDNSAVATAHFMVIDDEVLEVSEEIQLSVLSVEGGSLVGEPIPSVTFTVHDDELPKVALEVSHDLVSEIEQTEVTITVTTEVPVRNTQTIGFSITGEGIDENDYTVMSSSGDEGVAELIINDGEQSATATITIIRDRVNEGNEMMAIDISSVTSGIDSEFPETAYLTILDEYDEHYFIGPESFGWRENPDISAYYNNGYFDLENIIYSGTARIGKRQAATDSDQSFDSYVNFLGDGTNDIIMSGFNTLGHDDLRLGFDLIPVITRGQANAEADFRVEYSTDGGSTYSAMNLEWNHTGERVFERMQVTGFLPQSENLTLKFTNLEDNNSIGWWMDNVSLYHDNPRPMITLSINKDFVLEIDEEVLTLTATLSEPLDSDEYVFLNDAFGNHITDGEDVVIENKILFFPAGTTEVSTMVSLIDNEIEEYGKQLLISASSTSAGIMDRVVPNKLAVTIYDNDKPGPGEYFFKETLNNPLNIEPKSWGDREPPTYLNRDNRPWSNMNDHVRYQHFWNAEDFLITGNANISCSDILGGMSREEHADWNAGAEKYEGASGAHYFFLNENGMYVVFDNIRVYQSNTTLRFGMYRFENWNTDGRELIVEYSTDSLRTWNTLTFDALPFQPNWFRVTVNQDLPLSNAMAIRFKVENLTGANIVKLDDIELIQRQTKVTSISNDYAKRGQEIVIRGENFINVSSVKVGGATFDESHFIVDNSTTIRFTIPEALTSGGLVSVLTAYDSEAGPEFILDDRAMASLFVEKNTLQEASQEETVLYAELDVPAREDGYIQIALLSNPNDIELETDTLFFAEGETRSDDIIVKAVLDDFVAEPDEIVTISMASVISGHLDLTAQTSVDVTIINEPRYPVTYRVIGQDSLYENTQDEVLVFATVPFKMKGDLTLPLTIGGTADNNDYLLNKEEAQISFKQGDQISDTLKIQVINDGVIEEKEMLTISALASTENPDYIIPAFERSFYIIDGFVYEDEKPEPPTSIEDVSKYFKVWASDAFIHINSVQGKGIGEVVIHNLMGQVIERKNVQESTVRLPFNHKGIFIVRISDGNDSFAVKVICQ